MNEIYKDVLRFADIPEGRFRSLYSLTLSELCAEFGEEYVLDAKNDSDKKSGVTVGGTVENLSETGKNGRFGGCAECFPEYRSAVVNNILYLDNTEKSVMKELSISQRADAYASVWRRKFAVKSAKPHSWR